MANNTEGGKKAAQTNKRLYGADFYQRLGSKGGKVRVSKGFGTNKALARHAGMLGGLKSRKPQATK